MKAINNFVLIRCDSQYSEEIQHGELKLVVDPAFNPTARTTTTGIVESVGHKCPAGELEPGDTAHFHYGAIDGSASDFEIEKGLYRVAFSDVLCRQRPGSPDIISVGEWIVLRPVKKQVPEGYEVVKYSGRIALQSKKTGIVNPAWDPFDRDLAEVVSDCRGQFSGIVCVPEKMNWFDNYGRKIDGKLYIYAERSDVVGTYL
jgi:hypothetical protein